MLCYFISKKNCETISCKEVVSYACALDLDCGGKTTITVAGDPGASDEDFVILKDGNNIEFKGIVDSIENADGGAAYSVSCLEIEHCFARKILLSDADVIKDAGLEDFVAKTIETYFADTGDSFIDMSYIRCNALTHTKVSSKPSTESGIYNLKTYLGNIKEQYGIFLDFEFTSNKLIITIHKKEQSEMQIDITTTDIVSCVETYKIKVLTKLNVIWLNTTTNEESTRCFYLHSDRSISEVDEDRVDGTISTIYIEAETEEEMIQNAKNEFKSNSYSHSIEAVVLGTSKIYPIDELYVGHEVTIKTAAAGIKESIISEISFADNAQTIAVKFGILKVSLTDKLR